MTPEKAQQLGNDLACLAASISEIAEELKAMYDFDGEHEDATESKAEVSEAELPQETTPKPPTFEEVRAELAEISRNGHTEAIRGLILKFGATRLSDLDPSHHASILEEARRLK